MSTCGHPSRAVTNNLLLSAPIHYVPLMCHKVSISWKKYFFTSCQSHFCTPLQKEN